MSDLLQMQIEQTAECRGSHFSQTKRWGCTSS